MADSQHSTNTLRIEVEDRPLAQELMPFLVMAIVDDSINLPDMFVLTFRDPDRQLLDRSGMAIGKRISISLVSTGTTEPERLLTNAEITALEAEYDPAGTLTVVRGFDKSHRLFRGRHTDSYRNATYSDIAKKVAQRTGLDVGRVDSTRQVFDHVSQGNVSDWEFLKGLADRIGYELTVVDGKMDFRKPDAGTAPEIGNLRSQNPFQLILGSNLLRFRCAITSADQVKKVHVRGWSVQDKKPLVGIAPAETSSADLSVKPDELGSLFGNPISVSVATPYGTQTEVDSAAHALSQEIAGSFALLDGVARGNPKLKAGRAVSLGRVGKPFDGSYTLTTTRHIYDPLEGYMTSFTVSGRQERSMLGLSSGTNGLSTKPIHGVVPAIVTDARDPDSLCRVKLRFPWMSETYETDWVRTVQPGAGKERGAIVVPEVNDEVLVGFEHGNLKRPYVIGGLYNGLDRAASTGTRLIDPNSGAVNLRALVSRAGHRIVLCDETGSEHVEIRSADGKLRIRMNQSNTAVEVNSDGVVSIKARRDVEISADSNLKLSAGANVEVEATGELKLRGRRISVEGSGPVALKGNPIQLN